MAVGDRNDLMETAALLEKIDGTLAAAYASLLYFWAMPNTILKLPAAQG